MNRILLIVLAFTVLSCNSNSDTKQSHQDTIDSDSLQKNSVRNPTQYKFKEAATLTGKLEGLRYTNAAGEWFNTHILILDSGITVDSNNPEFTPVSDLKEVQIGFDIDKIPNPKIYLDKTITLTGILYDEQTAHDRRPVVMINATVEQK